MQKKEYIHIGSSTILQSNFRNILRPLDNFSLSPSGGFYACEFKSFNYISDWYKYLLSEIDIAKYKNLQDATVFTLKENANILIVEDYQTVSKLIKEYPSYHQILSFPQQLNEKNTIFDFEALSRDYDGIYLNYKAFAYKGQTIIFDNWYVDTLLLFNLDCINSYYSASIDIDLESYFSEGYAYPYLTIKNGAQKVEDLSDYYLILYKKTKEIYRELIQKKTFNDYDEFLTQISNCLRESLLILTENNKETIKSLNSYLKSKGIDKREDIIVKNILLNYLSSYLFDQQNKIINLPKSKVKTYKQYFY